MPSAPKPRTVAVSTPPKTLSESADPYFGMLYPTEDYKVYG